MPSEVPSKSLGSPSKLTDVRMDVQIPPVFYRTLSPFGAEAKRAKAEATASATASAKAKAKATAKAKAKSN